MTIRALAMGLLLAVVAPRDPTLRVHDFARLLSPEQQQSLEALARDLERETTAQLAIVTVGSLDGMTVDQYAHALFNQWGIGRKGVNNGVLLLVAPNERRTRIEVGYGLEPLLTDALCGEIRDRHLLPRFRANDYAGGIAAGALAVVGVLVASRRLYSTTAFAVASAVGLGLLAIAAYFTWIAPRAGELWALLGGAGTASLAAWCFNLVKYRRFGPKGCSKCGTPLELLSEQDDDPKLSAVQRLEEKIGSVDYDVWICPACLNNDTERYIKIFSGFSDCPACRARTFKEDPQRVIRRATTSRTGLARVEGRCVACNHKTVRQIVLPIITSSSSSSRGGSSFGGGGGGGGGFGGGSSGGGGASGGW